MISRLLRDTPVLFDYRRYGKHAKSFGYKVGGLHGIEHILRVLLLSLIYYYSDDTLTEADKQILVYFSLLHDVGRTNDDLDDQHGAMSVKKIEEQNLKIRKISLTETDYQIAHMIIRYHCLDDDLGLQAIQEATNFSSKDRERAIHLFHICKDMDALDRVRFNGLDYRFLRTRFAKGLVLVAEYLLNERMLDALEEGICSTESTTVGTWYQATFSFTLNPGADISSVKKGLSLAIAEEINMEFPEINVVTSCTVQEEASYKTQKKSL